MASKRWTSVYERARQAVMQGAVRVVRELVSESTNQYETNGYLYEHLIIGRKAFFFSFFPTTRIEKEKHMSSPALTDHVELVGVETLTQRTKRRARRKRSNE